MAPTLTRTHRTWATHRQPHAKSALCRCSLVDVLGVLRRPAVPFNPSRAHSPSQTQQPTSRLPVRQQERRSPQQPTARAGPSWCAAEHAATLRTTVCALALGRPTQQRQPVEWSRIESRGPGRCKRAEYRLPCQPRPTPQTLRLLAQRPSHL